MAEKQLNKAVGERMMLSVEELGITVEGEATLSYTVEKTLGAGTTKSKTAEVHQIMAIEDNQFVVESGYFYDISITAAFTDGGSITEVVRVCASDVVVFGFETEAETSVSIGSGYLQFSKEEIDGNTVLKIWNPTGVTNTGAWFEWGTLLSSADMAVGETVTYDVYADVGHSYAVSSSNWALQLNQGGEGTVSGGYVTANARCKIGTVTYKTAGGLTTMYSNFVVQGANVNGNPNYFTFDNVVFVRTDLPIEETETSLTVASKQINKVVGETVVLSADNFGVTVEGEATLSYTVEKTLGAGTTKSKTAEVHQTMAIEDNQFVVESGYFYDISITAAFTDGGSITEVVRVCASDVVVFGFETEAETSVSIGSGYLQFSKEEIDGNTVLKIWNPTGVTNTGAWFEWGTLLSSADMAVGETVTYDVYADVGHSYAVSSSNWALQLNQGGEGTVSGGYVTANARCKIGTVTYKTAGGLTTMYSNFVVQGANVNGNPNYFTFDNVVFVRTDLPVEETETSLTIASKQ